MFEAIKNWWKARNGDDESAADVSVARTGSFDSSNSPPSPTFTPRKSDRRVKDRRRDNEAVDQEQNVLIRNKYVREDTGTHETLKILDDSLVDSGEETGIDPYNTGGFDRSRNWESRFRK